MLFSKTSELTVETRAWWRFLPMSNVHNGSNISFYGEIDSVDVGHFKVADTGDGKSI